MSDYSPAVQIGYYGLPVLMGLYALLVFTFQLQVIRGKAMPNCDGTVDSWHEQKIFYGIALADVVLACPATFVGLVLLFVAPRWGNYLLSLVAFWLLWANLMTTFTSLRFEKPKITGRWLIEFPSGAVLGLGYLAWAVYHFDAIFH